MSYIQREFSLTNNDSAFTNNDLGLRVEWHVEHRSSTERLLFEMRSLRLCFNFLFVKVRTGF